MSDTANSAAPAAEVASPATESAENQQDQDNVEESSEASASSNEGDSKSTIKKEEKKEIQRQLKKYKLKVDGQEFEEEIDLSNDEEIIKRLQLAKASQKRMQESNEIRKAAVQFIEDLRKNPKKILSDPNIGIDVKKFAQDILNEQLEEESKTPEQRETEKLQKELEELKSKAQKDEEERKQKEFERLQSEAETKLEDDITSALDTSNLPKTPYTVKKMAELMMVALQNNIDLSAKDIIPLLRNQMKADIKEMLTTSNDDVLEEILDKQIQDRLRKRNIAKSKRSVETANNVKSTTAEAKTDIKDDKKMLIRDFLGI